MARAYSAMARYAGLSEESRTSRKLPGGLWGRLDDAEVVREERDDP